MARVLISAAHTLENPGEIFQDLREADLTRKILKKTIPYLEAHKIEFQPVPLDLQLLQRIEWINQTGYTEEQGDVFLEIHINDGNKRGVEGWFRGAADATNKSQKFADAMVNGICKYTGYQSQGAKSEYEHDLGSLIILNQINPIGSAVECLYIDNPDDIVILRDEAKLDALAKAIADSINDYIKGVNQPSAVSLQPAVAAPAPIAQAPQSFSPAPSFTPPAPSFAPPASPFGGGSSFPKPTFGGNAGSPFGAPATGGGNKPLVMDREERKEMIKKIYTKVLGKEPSQNDLNYYLNTGVNENDLIKKLVEGPDHEKMVKDANESKGLKDASQKQEAEIAQLKANSQDFKAMQESLNRLLEHKNMLISRLQQELVNNNILPSGQHIDSMHNTKTVTFSAPSPKKKYPSGFTGFIMRFFKL